MPSLPSATSLRSRAMAVVAKNYELLCYGCKARHQMNRLLNSDGEDYKKVPGPFFDLPSSLLEDIIQAVYEERSLPKESLHQLLLPQLKHYIVRNRASLHIQTALLQEKCHNLLSLDFTCCTSIQPGFFIKFFYNFPLLTKINLTGSLVDDETFNSIGSLCSGLREMIATDSTISDKGLLHLCRGEEGLRCRNLVSVSLAKTKCSAWGVASMLHFHPRLVHLGWPDISLVFQSFQDPDMVETTGQKSPSKLFLRKLEFSGETVTEDTICSGLLLCPQVVSLVIRPLAPPSPLLRDLLAASTISSLDLGSPKLTLNPLQFEEDVVPMLRSLGSRLTSLTLYRLPDIDVLMLGELCPRLTLLRFSAITSFLPVFDLSQKSFPMLQELELLNSVGAHIYTNTLRQLLVASTALRHLKFQFVDTLNDEVCAELLRANPLKQLRTLTLDQCHSVSLHSLLLFLEADNSLSELKCWSCRFITEDDDDVVRSEICRNNYDIYFSWYQFTGEEAPMLIEEMVENPESDWDEDDEEDEEEEEEDDNQWNIPALD